MPRIQPVNLSSFGERPILARQLPTRRSPTKSALVPDAQVYLGELKCVTTDATVPIAYHVVGVPKNQVRKIHRWHLVGALDGSPNQVDLQLESGRNTDEPDIHTINLVAWSGDGFDFAVRFEPTAAFVVQSGLHIPPTLRPDTPHRLVRHVRALQEATRASA